MLVALLISTLGIVLLAGMINSSMNMVTKSKDKIQDYVNAENVLAEQSASGTDGTVELDVELYDGCGTNISVEYYDNSENNSVSAFKVK